MPNKLIKRGYKIWALADKGYVYKFQIHTSKEGNIVENCLGEKVSSRNDKRCMNLLSNFHYPEDKCEVSRKEKNGTAINVSCLKGLLYYIKCMNCVD
ncbi:hypothetical protein PR048_031947 [Dryococelus australis]|uniref:Uncharacterized protein n=1 Tax=Dryococelus australis TaxID=614101 RepID=A0ABQ9G9M0_9NEOP|nr:hypothetical protein PR048_031947 [Dryococelus australis]